MWFKRKTLIDQLLDHRNQDLFDYVSKSLSLSVERTTAPYYGLYTQGTKAIVYVPYGEPSPSSFAHELLHAELKIRGVNFSTKLSVLERPALIPIFSDALSDHITNVLEHRKMFPRFLSLGYNEDEFLSDSRIAILTQQEVESLIIGLRHGMDYSAEGINNYIGKYLAARASCFSFFNYDEKLQQLRDVEPGLSSVLEGLVDRWDKYDIENEGDPLYDSYLMISFDFLNGVESWVGSVINHTTNSLWSANIKS